MSTSKVREELATFSGILNLQSQTLLLYGSYSTNEHVFGRPGQGVKTSPSPDQVVSAHCETWDK